MTGIMAVGIRQLIVASIRELPGAEAGQETDDR